MIKLPNGKIWMKHVLYEGLIVPHSVAGFYYLWYVHVQHVRDQRNICMPKFWSDQVCGASSALAAIKPGAPVT